MYSDKIYIGNDCVFPEDWTVDNLLGKHRSRPYNPLVANTFFRAGYIESWGRGIEKIKESCIENGNKMAEYQVSPSEVMVVFKSIESTANQGTDQANQGTDQVNEVEHKILKVIELNRSISQSEIAKEIDEKLSTVKYYMTQMKKQGKIERVGSSQKGYWNIRK